MSAVGNLTQEQIAALRHLPTAFADLLDQAQALVVERDALRSCYRRRAAGWVPTIKAEFAIWHKFEDDDTYVESDKMTPAERLALTLLEAEESSQ